MRQAFFMYGENGRLCINFGTRAGGIPQTKLSNVLKPTQTVFMAETDGNSMYPVQSASVNAAQSNTTGYYCVPRHSKGKYAVFSMCDGSSITARTNDFWRSQGEADDGTKEWAQERKIYWYPSADTPN
jgi:hypothetical protein